MRKQNENIDKIDDTICNLIVGFLSGSLSEEDLVILNNWLEEKEEHLKMFNQIRSVSILSSHEEGKKFFEAKAGWEQLNKLIKVSQRKKFYNRLFVLSAKYAASLLLGLIVGGTVMSIVLQQKESIPLLSESITTTIKVPLGSRTNITLPDGSDVWLNAGSTISYPTDFGTNKRDLVLAGEAYFSVKSDSIMPFNVQTSGMVVQALGTKFNVQAYPEDSLLCTTLEEGSVNVVVYGSKEKTTQKVKLKPSEKLIVRKVKQDIVAQSAGKIDAVQKGINDMPVKLQLTKEINVNIQLSTSWKDKKWIVEDKPLDVFIVELERRYNLDIEFQSGELKSYRFSGIIEGETVEQVLTAISLSAPISYNFDKNKVVLSLNTKDKQKFDKILNKDKY